MLTLQNALDGISSVFQQTLSETDVDSTLSELDQPAIFTQEKGKFSLEIWDGVSLINGENSAKVKEMYNLSASGVLYLIKDATTGNVLYIQPVNPFNPGVELTSSNAFNEGIDHINHISSYNADAETYRQLINGLIAKGYSLKVKG